MVLYHGSDHIIEKPVYGYGKKYNDYGPGFYCTEDMNLAMEWAVDEGRDGFANKYEINESEMTVLNLTDPEYSVLNWIAILLENREFQAQSAIAREAKKYIREYFLPEYEKYDLIRGYRADDSYFSFARDFINNTISLQQLGQAMTYGKLGEQIVLKSKKAFEGIRYVESERAENYIWYARKEERDFKARTKYSEMEKSGFKKGETYIIRIIEEELDRDDLCL